MMKNGDTMVVSMLVNTGDLAAAYAASKDEAYPQVLATPAMLGLMERACARLLFPLLKPGQMSVGARVELSHFSPTPLGSTVHSQATFDRQEGALYWFDVTVKDAGGTVGKGRHARAIVDQADIEEKALGRSAIKNI